METGDDEHHLHHHHQLVQPQLKRLSHEDIHMDSGYASYNLTGTSCSTNLSGSSPLLQSSASSTSSSVRKLLDLEPISEHRELHFLPPPLNETPTTRSIRQINEFHITTPVQNFAQLETTPTKGNYFFRSAQSPRGKGHAGRTGDRTVAMAIDTAAIGITAIHRQQVTPQKHGSASQLSFVKHVSFSDKLKSTRRSPNSHMPIAEDDLENDENCFDGSQMNASIGFSPINKSVGILHESPRRPGTSTPKRMIDRVSTKTVAKCQFTTSSPRDARSKSLRRFKSFSPAKRSASVLKEIPVNWQATLEKHDEQPEDDEQPANPARKMLKFSGNQFDALLSKRNDAQRMAVIAAATSASTATNRSAIASESTVIPPAPSTNQLPKLKARSRLILTRQSRIDESSGPSDFHSTNEQNTSISNKANSALVTAASPCDTLLHGHQMDLSPINNLPRIPKSRNSHAAGIDSREERVAPMATVTSGDAVAADPGPSSAAVHQINKTNFDMLIQSPILLATPTKHTGRASTSTVGGNSEAGPMITPLKALRRCISFNPTSAKGVANKENQHSEYSHLPCTPPKAMKRKPLKRLNASINEPELQQWQQQHNGSAFKVPAAKRKLYDDISRKNKYDGFEKLDILGHLMMENCYPLIDAILANLSDEQLQIAYGVSRTWARCIDDSPQANFRRRKFVRMRQQSKENPRRISMRLQDQLRETQLTDDGRMKLTARKPFTSRNLESMRTRRGPLVARSPPVSPSKRKFHENQKVVRTLQPGQKLTRCIRCDGNSIVRIAAAKQTANGDKKTLRPRIAKQDSCPIPRSSEKQSLAAATAIWRSYDDNRDPGHTNEYAECTRSSCGHRFCINCHRSPHPGHACPIKPLGSSPTSDDDQANRRNDIRNSRRNLRRLSRLKFND